MDDRMAGSTKNIVNLPIPRSNVVARATEIKWQGRYRTGFARMLDLSDIFSDFTLWKAQVNGSCHI